MSLTYSMIRVMLVELMCRFSLRMAFLMVADSGRVHEDRRQQTEDQRLQNTHCELEQEQRPGHNRGHQETDNKEQDRACEDITEKSEREREDFGELPDHFQ